MYPNTACILDFLRCSITYNNTQSLLNGLNKFVNSISNNEISCLLEIKRIKNGFKNIKEKWKSYKDAEYCDIKLNIVYQSPFGNNNKKCMLVEIQFYWIHF